MLIWSGLGFLVIVIVFASAITVELSSEAITGDDAFYQNHSSILPAISLYISAIIIYFLGKWLNTRKAKTYIDKQSGKEVMLKNNNTFFFIRMEYWGMIIFVLTIIFNIKKQFE